MSTTMVKGQVFTAENGKRYAIIKVEGIEAFILGYRDAADLAEKWALEYGEDSAEAKLMTKVAAAVGGNGRVQ